MIKVIILKEVPERDFKRMVREVEVATGNSRLREFEIDPCDGFCCGECSVKGCQKKGKEGELWLADNFTSAGIQYVSLIEKVENEKI